MKTLMTFVGAFIGAWCLGESSPGSVVAGLVVGGSIGYLLASVTQLQNRLRDLEAMQTTPALPPSAAQTIARPTTPTASPVPPAEAIAKATPVASSVAVPTAAPKTASVRQPLANGIDRLLHVLREFFTGEHAIPRIGVIILFFGVAFLLKYAAERNMLPIELRLFGAAVGAIALLVFGWRLRQRRLAYALVLQGGGIGVLYLTVFSALRLYSLIPPLAAFAILVALCVFSGALAILQNARALAVLAAAGGFLAPVLVSTGAGDHVMLFSYYALLNAGILGIAWFRAWRELNLLGFVFTFVIGLVWGVQRYRPEMFATTEPFLVLFFIFYVAVAVLFALRQPPKLLGYVDGTIVFGVPVVAFALQASLVHGIEYGLASSAAVIGAFYIGLATLLWRWRATTLRMLCEAFLALGIVFATLALPLALDGRWTSAAWALEGAAIVWVGVRQQRLLARAFGALLIFGAGVFFLSDLHRPADALPVLNSAYLGSLMIALAALFAAQRLQGRHAGLHAQERSLAAVLFAWGLLWWFGGGLREIDVRVHGTSTEIDSVVAFVVLSAVAAEFAGARISWMWLRNVALGLLPAGLLLAMVTIAFKSHVLTPSGTAAWILFFVAHAVVLKRHEDLAPRRYLDFLHGATVWWVALLGAHELAWVGREVAAGQAWSLIAWGFAPALAAVVATSMPLAPPWRTHRQAYATIGAIPVLGAAALWLLVANVTSRGDPAPLPYLPLFNPLDLVSMFVLVALVHRVSQARASMRMETFQTVSIIGGALAFIWLNATLLRTLHYWAGVAFELRALMDSVLVQASLSIFWASLALVVMLFATRRTSRTLWMVGAGLLAVVVLKLFIVDLARTGTLARIVSFIVVGVLLLMIGYLAPIPPTSERRTSREG